MEKEKFDDLVFEALEGLPKIFKRSLRNIEIVIEDAPTPEQAQSVNASHRRMVLGLYEGIPLAQRTTQYTNVLPDKISIFKNNIESICKTDEDIKRMVTHTTQHELAHHFGINDKRLKELGIY